MFKPKFSLIKSQLNPLLNQEPVAKLIRATALMQWRVVLTNITSSLLESLTEGATLGLVFLAVEIMSSQAGPSLDWSRVPLIGVIPELPSFLGSIEPSYLFIVLLSAALLVQAIQGACRFVNLVSLAYFSAKTYTLVSAKIHSHILGFTYPCSSGYKIGDLVDHASSGPQAVRIQIEQACSLVVLIPQCLTYIIVLIVISPWMLLAVVLIGFAIYQLQKLMLPRIRSGSQYVSNESVAANQRITEDFQGLRLLHSTGQLDFASKNLVSKLSGLETQLKKQAPRLALLGPVSTFLPILAITLIAIASVFILGGKGGGILPSLVTFVLALQRLTMRITMIGSVTNALADNAGRLERLNYILSSKDKSYRLIGGVQFRELQHSISFLSVSLSYGDNSHYALSDLSFTLEKGTTIALVGPSGAGKSSIADILTGLYSPTSGLVTIDDVPIQSYDLSSWQQQLGVVSQDTFLFNASIFDNISFGLSNATLESVEKASKLAQAHGFIDSLPDGYYTIVGERGYRLSGGQRQRLSLARALIRNPQLLILDEATSALDSQNEMLVQDAIQNLTNNYTVLVIAHRLSTIVNAQRILVMESGRIVQSGTHAELSSIPGLYRNLWNLQSNAVESL